MMKSFFDSSSNHTKRILIFKKIINPVKKKNFIDYNELARLWKQIYFKEQATYK